MHIDGNETPLLLSSSYILGHFNHLQGMAAVIV